MMKGIVWNKRKRSVVAVVLLWVLFLVLFGVYKLGSRGQDKRVANLTSSLKAETKKADDWWQIAKAAQEKSIKAQSTLEEKDAEIALKTATLEDCKKVVALPKPKAVAKRVAHKKPVAVAKVLAAPVPVPAPAPIPTMASVIPQLILRINVVEWSPVFAGKSLKSRDIGPVVRQGLADGTVVRVKEPLNFTVNGASVVVVHGGSAIVNPGTVSQATSMVIRPVDGARFASPPNGLALTTNPGELLGVVQSGVSEIWLNFILAPAAASSPPALPPPAKKENLGGPKGLPSLLLFLSNDGNRSREENIFKC